MVRDFFKTFSIEIVSFPGVNIIFDMTIWLGWGNSALNPVIYYSNLEHFNRLKNFILKVCGEASIWARPTRSNSKEGRGTQG